MSCYPALLNARQTAYSVTARMWLNVYLVVRSALQPRLYENRAVRRCAVTESAVWR